MLNVSNLESPTQRLAIIRAVFVVTLTISAAFPESIDAEEQRVIGVSVESKLSTEHWYPLPEEQMKAASLDTALSVLTSTQRFQILSEKDGGGSDRRRGRLTAELSLVGPASIAKCTLKLTAPDIPSLVSTASVSIKDMDYAGLYRAFEYIGREAALRMDDRFVSVGQLSRSSGDAGEVAELYAQAQEHKRSGEFAEARRKFAMVVDAAGPKHTKWREMAEEELQYGLPVFEVNRLFNRIGDPSVSVGKKAELTGLAINRTREVIAENQTHAQRVREANKLLDTLDMMLSSLNNIEKSIAVGNTAGLRAMLSEYYMSMGECPDEERLEYFLKTGRRPLFEVVGVSGNASTRSYKLTDLETGVPLELRCSDGEISLIP